MKLDEIKQEIEKLPESKQELARALLEKAVFQNKQMQELQKTIKKNGWVEDYRNGEHQSGRKKSAEADTYLSLSKVFNATIKQLNEMISDVADEQKADALTEFLKGKKMVQR